MTLEELWLLFPIILTPHEPAWADWYRQEAAALAAALPSASIARICHIGSTAVDTIQAKPIVDILVEAAPGAALEPIGELLPDLGYLKMSESPGRASYNKGYTKTGFARRVFHLHLRRAGDHDELYFRDYLLANRDAAKAYEALKLHLWKEYGHDRDAYTDRKTDFVQKCTKQAKAIYRGRYDCLGSDPLY